MDNNKVEDPKQRKRSLTELTLGWLAERLRKSESIKEAVQTGKYDVNSEKVAQSIISKQ